MNSVYDLCVYEEQRYEDTDFLLSCVFALINLPKPHIKGDPCSLRSQYIRILVLFMIEKVQSNRVFIETLLEKCCQGLGEACLDRGEFPNSLIYKKKIRLAQLLCCLCPWVANCATEQTAETITKKLVELIKIPYVHSARHYIERFLIVIMQKYPSFTGFIDLDYDMRPQLAGSYLLILGSVMVFTTNERIRQTVFNKLLPFVISNTAHIRRVAHFIMYKLITTYALSLENLSHVQLVVLVVALIFLNMVTSQQKKLAIMLHPQQEIELRIVAFVFYLKNLHFSSTNQHISSH